MRMQILELGKIAVSLLVPPSHASPLLHNSEIRELIEEKNWRQLKDILSVLPAPDIANLLESLEDEWKVIIFRLLPQQLAAEVFGELDSNKQISLLQQMNDERVRDIILALSPDDRTDLFEELPGEVTQRLLNLLPPEERSESLQLLGYPEESVGRLMTPDHVAIRPHWTIKEASEQIRRYGRDAETINMIYVVDNGWHLIGDIPLRRLILADPEQRVESIMDHEFVSISVFEDQEKAVGIMQRYNLIALPVVDSQNILLGIVTVDDVLDVLQEEVTEDIYHMAGIGATKEDRLLHHSIPTVTRLRLPWLVICLIGGMAAAGIIGIFEEVLATAIVLAAFIPVIMDMGGNIGTQSSTIVVRGLATGSVDIRKSWKLLWRELLIGLAIGVICGVAVGVVAQIWKGTPYLGMVVGISMAATITIAALLGAFFPILYQRIGVDPAIASGPAITTVKDITGLLIYFSIATWVMGL